MTSETTSYTRCSGLRHRRRGNIQRRREMLAFHLAYFALPAAIVAAVLVLARRRRREG